jgi:soluble lytic murein transglycosylase
MLRGDTIVAGRRSGKHRSHLRTAAFALLTLVAGLVSQSATAELVALPKPRPMQLHAPAARPLLISTKQTQDTAAHLLSRDDIKLYTNAFAAARKGDHQYAARLAKGAKDPLPRKVLTWMRLADERTDPSFAEIVTFLKANAEWPGLTALRRRAERLMPADLPNAQVHAYFTAFPPLSIDGVIREAKQRASTGPAAEAVAYAREAWVKRDFAKAEEATFLREFGNALRPEDHRARMDRLAWDGDDDDILRIEARVDRDFANLIQARRRLARLEGGVDSAINRLPPALRTDPALTFERLRWHRRKGNDDAMMELLAHQPADAPRLNLWWQERQILVRRLMDRGAWQQAYNLAAAHGQREGLGLSEAEWLSGWIALRKLNKPLEAFQHFDRLYRGVSMPISLSRGAYWAGRAAEAAQDQRIAAQWYEAAAVYPTTYYGQLAAARLNSEKPLILPADPSVSAGERSQFEKAEMTRLVRRLNDIGDDDLTRQFLARMSFLADTATDYVLVAQLARSLGHVQVSVEIARQAVADQVQLVDAGYPVLPYSITAVEAPLAHAITRQESNFDRKAISRSNARGLMQLLPGTAKETAGKLGIPFDTGRLTRDGGYNVTLGSSYLGRMVNGFDGSYVLAIAAYNGGPGRVRQWLNTLGDPRTPDVDVIDWIESIPLSETRNYVQRVLENLQVYRARMSGNATVALSLARDLARGG